MEPYLPLAVLEVGVPLLPVVTVAHDVLGDPLSAVVASSGGQSHDVDVGPQVHLEQQTPVTNRHCLVNR